VLYVLLNNSADVNHSYRPSDGVFYAAILSSQPLKIIKEIVRNRAIVSSRALFVAIEKEQLDVLQHLLQSSQIDKKVKSEDLIQYVDNTDNEEVITVVKSLYL
jgi:hypothetical protein